MRAGGGCTVQQALTEEAAVVVKQAVSLARRRGNGQVTPLHVASAMLQAPPPSGLLRAACLRSHSHPLQCKALELCFNVALNRLPASAGASSLFGGHPHQHQGHVVYYPPTSLSNALVAAFKRAQAHHRRGSVEAQGQPVLAVKIDLEQLVISILDDPSVSRVMREAGFSSPHVKANVEQDAALSAATDAHGRNPKPSADASSLQPHQETILPRKLPRDQVREEDVAAILDCLATEGKKRVMVVAESASAAEAAARAAVDKIKRGEARQEALRGARVVGLTVSMFLDAPRDEAERRLAELRCVVKAARGAVVLVVEDLMWASEFWAVRVEAGRRLASGCYYYCGVEHAVAEVRALLACRGDGVCLVGYGTYQAYTRCRTGHPSLESVWGIQTLAIPAGSLALSLNCVDVDSTAVALSRRQSMKAECDVSGNGSTLPPAACLSLLDGGASAQLTAASTFCADYCTATDQADAVKALHRSSIVPSSSSIPPWLHHCQDQEPPCKKWSSTCGGSPSHRTTTLNKNFSTVVSPSPSVSFHERHCRERLYQPWLVADAHEPKHASWRAQDGGYVNEAAQGVRLLSAAAKSRDSSASSSSVEVECRSRFKELSAENLKVLCAALEKEVPLQKEIVPEIASTVLRCRSGTAKRRNGTKEETWLLFLGCDTDGKEKVARELASLVFGSRRSFVLIDVNALSPARSDSTDQHRAAKRPRPEASRSYSYLERLFEAVRDNPHRVILMDGVDQVDRRCLVGIKEAIESGVVRSHVGDEVSLGDAIVVLSCESFDSRSRSCCSPPTTKNAKAMSEEAVTTSSTESCFDLNMSVDDVEEVEEEEECCFGDAGLFKAVDRTLFFRPPENLCTYEV
uniref:Uncharacterized protein n=1 Tax=Avena sativa TaxID=4498 RepID=A0ACD5Z612_AVESA